jgi:hypothetical protein
MEQALTFDLIIGVAFLILSIVLIAFWIALPFAVFRIKQRLDETNRHLETIVEQLKAQTEAGATLSLDETNKHLKVIVERLKPQTEATLNRKKPVKTFMGGRVLSSFVEEQRMMRMINLDPDEIKRVKLPPSKCPQCKANLIIRPTEKVCPVCGGLLPKPAKR